MIEDDASEKSTSRWVVALVAVIVLGLAVSLQLFLVRIPAYSGLYERFEFYVPETLKSALEIALVGVAVAALYRISAGAARRELGIVRPGAIAIAVVSVATLPLWIVFGLTTPVRPGIDPAAAFYLVVVSPLAEEIVFRGFAFRQLFRRAKLGFWPAVIITAVVFGLVHTGKGATLASMAGIFLITGVGGAFFAWIFVRWNESVVVPWTVHALMNLSWQVFEVGDTALAGWIPSALQASVLILAIGLTIVVQRRASHEASRLP